MNASQLLQRAMRTPPSYFVFLALLATLWITNPNMLNVQNRQTEDSGLKVLPTVSVGSDYNTRLVTCIVHLTRKISQVGKPHACKGFVNRFVDLALEPWRK